MFSSVAMFGAAQKAFSRTPRQQVRGPSHISVGLSATVYRRIRWLVRMEGSEDGIFGLVCRLIGRWAKMVQHLFFFCRGNHDVRVAIRTHVGYGRSTVPDFAGGGQGVTRRENLTLDSFTLKHI